MPHGVVDELQHIFTSSDGSFKGTAYVRVHVLPRLSGAESHGCKGLSSKLALDTALAITLPSLIWCIGDDLWEDLQSPQTDLS